MSSYFGLPAGVGGSLAVLARGVSVSVTSTAAQAVFTAPQACVVTACVLRSPNVALSATTSFKVGHTGALTNLIATTVATSLPTNAIMNCTTANTSSVTTGVATAAGAIVYFSPVVVDPTAVSATIDLLGYVL